MRPVYILSFICLLGICAGRAFARQPQKDSGPLDIRMNFICTSTSDDSIQLKAILQVKHEEGATCLVNALVRFSIAGTDEDIPLGNKQTDIRGTALLKIPVRKEYPRNEEQLITIKARFDGNDKYSGAESEFAFKPVKMRISFYVEDSVKYIRVAGSQYNSDGTIAPLGPVDLIVAVPKMFSNLKVAEISLDSTGTGSAEFPDNIIGDSLGNLIVLASIEENEIYGNAIATGSVNWGLKKHLISPDRPSRELWTPIAPLWMIITLIIMLSGVWGHYIYAIIQLILIRRSGMVRAREEKAEEVP